MTKDDQSLVAEALDGRLEAYDELMERYQRLVYKVAFGYARSHEGALDLTQTVFLKVYRSLDTFRGRSRFKSWLIRIACNEGVSWVRANRRHLEGREPLTEVGTQAVVRPKQEAGVVASERRRQLLGGLAGLNPRYRTALILRYFHELSVREVASVLECSEGTAKSVLFRGLNRLREQVAGS